MSGSFQQLHKALEKCLNDMEVLKDECKQI
nr:MAG TPA: hypothetical protein [Caudoviricetes sp.]